MPVRPLFRPPFRLLAGIALLLSAHGAYAVTTLTMTTEYPATSMPGQGVSTFADLVRANTAGNVVIDATYDASKGIKSGDMIDAVEARKVDAGDAFRRGAGHEVSAVRGIVAALPGGLAGQGAQLEQGCAPRL